MATYYFQWAEHKERNAREMYEKVFTAHVDADDFWDAWEMFLEDFNPANPCGEHWELRVLLDIHHTEDADDDDGWDYISDFYWHKACEEFDTWIPEPEYDYILI